MPSVTCAGLLPSSPATTRVEPRLNSWLASAYVFCKALIAIALWGGASIGYFFAPLAWWQWLLATAAAFLLVVALPITDEIGFALALLFLATDWLKRRRRASAAAV